MTEIAQAAERLRRSAEAGYYVGPLGQLDRDERLLANAYLAEHPADDAEPVTEEWLRSVGFEQFDPRWPNALSIGVDDAHDLEVCFGTEQTGWMARDHYDYTPRAIPFDDDPAKAGDYKLSRIPSGLWPKTRGAVRRLCADLGVPLKEPHGP